MYRIKSEIPHIPFLKKEAHTMKRHYLYGLLGLLSLLGFVGVFTQERAFLAFFAFAVDFTHFFQRKDEMAVAYLNRSAALGFHWGMAATGVVAAGAFFLQGQESSQALVTGLAAGFAVAVVVHALAELYFVTRERWGLTYDPD